MNDKEFKQLKKTITFIIFVIIFLVTGAIGDSIGSYFFGFFLSTIYPDLFLGKSLGELLVFFGSGIIGDILFSEITGKDFEFKF